jgi:thiol-disulfide isomerase/thioredoxin
VSTGAWVLVIAVGTALSFGLFRSMTDGRFRGRRRAPGTDPVQDEQPGEAVMEPESVLAGTPWDDQLGERATLVQFSSAFCAPCRATRRILGDVAAASPGVVHLEVDAELHLDVVRRLGIVRTPTTLVLDARGHEVTRATGAPTKQQVLSALSADPHPPPRQ